RLVIGRDRLGIKPLYLMRTQGRVAFASEAKALLALPGASCRLDPVAVHGYLNLGYVPAPLSIFEGIEKLPPASLLVLEQGRESQQCYWRISPQLDHDRTEADWVEEVRSAIEHSVRMQMVSDVPIGAFLSGGIDSS